MKILPFLALSVLLTGCLSTKPRAVSLWNLEYDGPQVQGVQPAYDTVRLLQLSVVAPYDTRSLTVLREDGTVAYDPFNEFATTPTPLMKTVAFSALAKSGVFGSVVNATSSVRTACAVEITVTRLALDCRKKETRRAEVGVMVRLVRNNELVKVTEARATADAKSGNYGAAFSEAASKAMSEAVAGLR